MSWTCPVSPNVSSKFPEDGTGHCQLRWLKCNIWWKSKNILFLCKLSFWIKVRETEYQLKIQTMCTPLLILCMTYTYFYVNYYHTLLCVYCVSVTKLIVDFTWMICKLSYTSILYWWTYWQYIWDIQWK